MKSIDFDDDYSAVPSGFDDGDYSPATVDAPVDDYSDNDYGYGEDIPEDFAEYESDSSNYIPASFQADEDYTPAITSDDLEGSTAQSPEDTLLKEDLEDDFDLNAVMNKAQTRPRTAVKLPAMVQDEDDEDIPQDTLPDLSMMSQPAAPANDGNASDGDVQPRPRRRSLRTLKHGNMKAPAPDPALPVMTRQVEELPVGNPDLIPVMNTIDSLSNRVSASMAADEAAAAKESKPKRKKDTLFGGKKAGKKHKKKKDKSTATSKNTVIDSFDCAPASSNAAGNDLMASAARSPFRPMQTSTTPDLDFAPEDPNRKSLKGTKGAFGAGAYRADIGPAVHTPGKVKNYRGMRIDPLAVLSTYTCFLPIIGFILGIASLVRYRQDKYEQGRYLALLGTIVSGMMILLAIIGFALNVIQGLPGGLQGFGVH